MILVGKWDEIAYDKDQVLYSRITGQGEKGEETLTRSSI